jgi:hypothetical protein
MDNQRKLSCAVMQPYFLPYIGYFQLISSVDTFVLYDDIQYTKKGWINRNRFLLNGVSTHVTLPLRKDSDFLLVRERVIADDFLPQKILNVYDAAYRRANYYDETREVLEDVLKFEERNLFKFIHNAITRVCDHLQIHTPIVLSSSLCSQGDAKGVNRVLQYCYHCNSSVYINPPGGRELYRANDFMDRGVSLRFLVPSLSPYVQNIDSFVPALSIIDNLAHCGQLATAALVQTDYTIDVVDGT